MERAVAREEFERAALLRDQIRRLNQDLGEVPAAGEGSSADS
jgi:protein-arginine kinase activator protein McsA